MYASRYSVAYHAYNHLVTFTSLTVCTAYTSACIFSRSTTVERVGLEDMGFPTKCATIDLREALECRLVDVRVLRIDTELNPAFVPKGDVSRFCDRDTGIRQHEFAGSARPDLCGLLSSARNVE